MEILSSLSCENFYPFYYFMCFLNALYLRDSLLILSGMEEKVCLLLMMMIMLRTLGLILLGFVFFFYCSWDEWVVIDRLMKHTEENMRVKLSIDAEFGNEKNARKPRASSKASNGQIFIFYIFCYRE